MKKRAVLTIFVVLIAIFGAAVQIACTADAEESFIQIAGVPVETKINKEAKRYCKKNGVCFAEYYSKKLAETGSERAAVDSLCEGLFDRLVKIAEDAYVEPVEPRVEFIADREETFRYVEGSAGRRADLPALCLDAAKAMDTVTSAELKYLEIPPSLSIDELKAGTALVSSFSTSYASSGEARRFNVELAAEKLNGWKISAGGLLSFNAVVGARTEENGFRIAKVIENGEFKNGVGGGVCQVSSTLYNAWALAGLAVRDRRSHSLPVSYLGLGLDATVSENIDMVLENDSVSDVYVSARAESGKLTFCVYGTKSEFEVRLETEKIADIDPPAPRRVGEGKRLVAYVEGKKGCVIRCNQCFYRAGALAAKKQLPDSYYAPKQGVNYYISAAEE